MPDETVTKPEPQKDEGDKSFFIKLLAVAAVIIACLFAYSFIPQQKITAQPLCDLNSTNKALYMIDINGNSVPALAVVLNNQQDIWNRIDNIDKNIVSEQKAMRFLNSCKLVNSDYNNYTDTIVCPQGGG